VDFEAAPKPTVSVQAQASGLFIRLREELNLNYLFITFDPGARRHPHCSFAATFADEHCKNELPRLKGDSGTPILYAPFNDRD
jgi:hypothetical protein